MSDNISDLLYRDWLNLNLHLLWCHDNYMLESYEVDDTQTGPLRFTEHDNSGAWLVYEGWARVEQDGDVVTAMPGQWLIVKPGKRVQKFARNTRMLSVAFDARWPDGAHLFEHGLSLVIDEAEVPELKRSTTPMLRLMKKINPGTWDARQDKVDIGTFLRIERLLCNWLLTLNKVLRRYGVIHAGKIGIDDRVRKAVELLNARNLSTPLDLENFAAQVGICENHLIRLFRQDLQSTPYQYFDKLRVEYACSRLKQQDTRIKETAVELGFEYLSHFSKWFKKHVGPSPREYKKRNAG